MKKGVKILIIVGVIALVLAICLPLAYKFLCTPQYEFELNEDGKSYALTGMSLQIPIVTHAEIPDTYKDLPVTRVRSMHDSTGNIEKITVPDSVTYIESVSCYGSCREIVLGKNVETIKEWNFPVFRDSSKLEIVTVPEGVKEVGGAIIYLDGKRILKELPYTAYDNAYYLGNESNPYQVLMAAKSKDITSCQIHEDTTVIASGAFKNCTKLQEIVIPNGIKSISNYSFNHCSSLTSVTIPDSVTSIGDEAFYYCSGLMSVTIGTGLKSIGKCAFYGCSGLMSMTLRSEIESIGERAFQSCGSLTSMTIPWSVTSIGKYAFEGCRNLTNVTFGISMGWSVDTTALVSSDLVDTEKAATYLKETYYDKAWTRN